MKKGFTLLEVLLTIILVSGGFAALLEASSAGLFAAGTNESELIAINLAQEKIEELRNKSYSDIAGEAKAVVSGFPAFQREVAAVILQAGLKQISVNVYWQVKSSEINTSLVTYVSDI